MNWGTVGMRSRIFGTRRLGATILSGWALLAAPAPLALPSPAMAQDGAYFIQIAARPTLSEGEAEARRFAAGVAGVSGFEAPGGWYVVALGPFSREEADERLVRLRAEGRIPRDSFLIGGDRLRDRFFLAADAAPASDAPAETVAEEEPVIDFDGAAALIAAQNAPAPVAETLEDARASESLLTPDERDQLQIALAGSGFYSGPIDGDFGRGTRAAMSAWQTARGMDATGVLTSAQRGALLGEYNAVFDGLDLEPVRDPEAGIALDMPTAVVALDGYETPFARYEATGAVPEARVILISQEGDRNDLAGLYEIMQTLAIVPPDGPRERSADSFDIEGRGPSIVSRTHAVHGNGRIKGFTLVWPAGDSRFERLEQRMRESFDPTLAGVLGPERATPVEEQDIDLLAGLDVRKPDLVRSGFFVDDAGRVLTTSEIADDCRTVRLDESYEARVLWSEGEVSLLEPTGNVAPPAVATIAEGPLRIGEEIAVGGYPFGGVLARAAVTFGTLSDVKGLGGEVDLDRYEVETVGPEAGGPVLGPDGAVTGMLLAPEGSRVLPADVALGIDAGALRAALRGRGLNPRSAEAGERLAPEIVVRRASEITVQVSCYR